MDRLKQYREFIKEILREYDRIVLQSPEPGVDSVLSFDEEHDT
ncbi:hypothetical protein CKA32_003201 [Geitlerinema sp. FC II]|nr:hypothetical protein CKA32_003201 [Geitlerinema sp. FC II]